MTAKVLILHASGTNRDREAAWACELAGGFYLKWQKSIPAQAYLQRGYEAYLKWGALAKVKDLAARYPQLDLEPDRDAAAVGHSNRGVLPLGPGGES